jgi:putative hydrolase of the HAD superfamily
MGYRGVIFDLGGVIFPSPLDHFDVYNDERGLPPGFVRALIRTSSETGAWAAHERGELPMAAFLEALDAEALAAGQTLGAAGLMAALAGGFGPRAEMLEAIARLRAQGLRTAALTNNWRTDPGTGIEAAFERDHLFDVVVESAVEGLRKPDPRIYEMTLDRIGLSAPECVYLDDLGINLKPARAMGMTTIKVVEPQAALAELEALVGFPLADRS